MHVSICGLRICTKNSILPTRTDYGHLFTGGRALIIGASGGCGVAGLQLARYFGASEIIGVSSAKNRDLVMREGATGHVDYATTNFADRYGESAAPGERFHVVYDCASGSGAGEQYKDAALACLRKPAKGTHGQYVAINGGIGMWARKFTIGQKANEHLFLTDVNTKDLNLLANLADVGWADGTQKLNPIMMKVLPLDSQSQLVRKP